MMIPDRAPEKVTIEDLLRLKRAERPSAEFWTRFEQDLRAKQLAAIVEKRPWWIALGLPQMGRSIARFQVPAGAAAALALSLVVVNHYRFDPPSASTGQSAQGVSASASQVAVNPPSASKKTSELVAVIASTSGPAVMRVSDQALSKADAVDAPARAEVAFASVTQARQPAELTSMIPWGAGQAGEAGVSSQASVSTGLLQTGLQVPASSLDLVVTSLLDNGRTERNTTQADRAELADAKPVVAQASSSPRELRRAKLLAGLVLADSSESSDVSRAIHGRDIAANGLSDDQLYDSARRLGMGGDRFTLKF